MISKRLVKAKETAEAPKRKERKRNTEEVVIDLHITELLDEPEGLSNREMLDLQMETVESEMNLAIKNHAKRIVFIHGVGQGVLKQEGNQSAETQIQKILFPGTLRLRSMVMERPW